MITCFQHKHLCTFVSLKVVAWLGWLLGWVGWVGCLVGWLFNSTIVWFSFCFFPFSNSKATHSFKISQTVPQSAGNFIKNSLIWARLHVFGKVRFVLTTGWMLLSKIIFKLFFIYLFLLSIVPKYCFHFL